MQECPFKIDTSDGNNQGIHLSNNQFINRILWGFALPALTVKSGWTPYVYYTTPYTVPCYTALNLLQIYWAHFLEKWGNQSKR